MGNDAGVLKRSCAQPMWPAASMPHSDPVVMMDTVKLCAANGVSIGFRRASLTCRASAAA